MLGYFDFLKSNVFNGLFNLKFVIITINDKTINDKMEVFNVY